MATVSAVVGTISTLVALVISVTQFRWAAEERRERKRLALASTNSMSAPTITRATAATPAREPEGGPTTPIPVEQPPIADEPSIEPVAAPGPVPGDAPVPQSIPRAVKATKPPRSPQPGDVICADCGEGNPPTRRFCRRCGASLGSAEIYRRPWWKKLWPHKAKSPEVGDRRARASKVSAPHDESFVRILLGPDHAVASPRPRLWPLIAFGVLAVISAIVLLMY